MNIPWELVSMGELGIVGGLGRREFGEEEEETSIWFSHGNDLFIAKEDVDPAQHMNIK